MASRIDIFAAKYPKLAEACKTGFELVSAMRITAKSEAKPSASTLQPAKSIVASGPPPTAPVTASDAPAFKSQYLHPVNQRAEQYRAERRAELTARRANKSTPIALSMSEARDLADSLFPTEPKTKMQTTPTNLSIPDRVKILMAEGATYDEAYDTILSRSNITRGDAPEASVTMSDPTQNPAYGKLSRPSPAPAADSPAITEMLVRNDVRHAQQTAVENAPKPVIPPPGSAYANALKLIANSPNLSTTEAKSLAMAALAQDEAAREARIAAMISPDGARYKQTLVRG